MRTIMAAFLLSLALVAPATLVAAPAEAAPARGCVTKAEYKKVKRGMSPAKVKRIFGTGGKQTYSYIGNYVFSQSRDYKACSPFNKWSSISVDFSKKNRGAPWKVDGKSAIWIRNF